MNKLFLILIVFISLLIGVLKDSPYQITSYKIKSSPIIIENQGYCLEFFEVTLYEDETNRFYIPYSGCQYNDYLYIYHHFQLISVKEAMKKGLISVHDLDKISFIIKQTKVY